MRDLSKNLAFEAALALVGTPSLADLFRRRPLPDGVTEILHILADYGSGQIDRGARLKLEFYVQNVLLFNGAPPHRILGVNPGASREDMRTHMRLLMLWLHPDVAGADAWRTAFAPRVISAWRDVSGGAVDATRPAAPAALQVRPAARRRVGAARQYGSPLAWAGQDRGPRPKLRGAGAWGARGRLRRLAVASVIASLALAGAYFFASPSNSAYVSGFQLIGSFAPW